MSQSYCFHRRSIRLQSHDYSQPGAYFITINSNRRKLLFGKIIDGVLVPSTAGKIVEEEWLRSEQVRQELILDAFVLMPNHLHGIVWIRSDHAKHEGGQGRSMPR